MVEFSNRTFSYRVVAPSADGPDRQPMASVAHAVPEDDVLLSQSVLYFMGLIPLIHLPFRS